MFFRCKISHGIEYLQLVRCDRVEGRPRQSVLATLGRTADLVGTGAIERMLRSAARLSKSAMAVAMSTSDSVTLTNCRQIGLALVFKQLWRDTGCARAISLLAPRYGLSQDFEHIAWSHMLEQQTRQRCDRTRGVSERAQPSDGFARLNAADVGRINDLLGRGGPSSRGGSRCLREEMEEQIFFQLARRSDHLTLVLFRERTAQPANSRNGPINSPNKPLQLQEEIPQAVVAAVIDSGGKIVCCDAWANDSFTVAELWRMIEKLQKRFMAERIALVADADLVDDKTRALVGEHGIQCHFGPDLPLTPSLRLQSPVSPAVAAGVPFSSGGVVGDISDKLDFLAHAGHRVRDTFGPILREFVPYDSAYRSNAALRNNIFFAFLGLRMREELETRLATNGHTLSWPELIDELRQMLEFEFEHADERYILRTPPSNLAKLIFTSLGIAPLPLIEPIRVPPPPRTPSGVRRKMARDSVGKTSRATQDLGTVR